MRSAVLTRTDFSIPSNQGALYRHSFSQKPWEMAPFRSAFHQSGNLLDQNHRPSKNRLSQFQKAACPLTWFMYELFKHAAIKPTLPTLHTLAPESTVIESQFLTLFKHALCAWVMSSLQPYTANPPTAQDAGRPGLTLANKVQPVLMMLAAPALPTQTKCS